MPAGEDEIYRSLRFDRDGVDFSKWPKLSCSAANELTLATQDDPNLGFARLAIAGELKLQIGVAVNELSSDEKLTNNSDLAIPTQKAVKTYVDNQIAVVNQSLSTKAALTGAASQDFQSNNLSVSGNLTANGNVSIGTTSSSYKLAIAAGDINIDDGRALRQAGRWIIGGDSKILSIGSSNKSDGRDISFDPGFSGALTIKKDTGNVGIGTANPIAKLQVSGNLMVDGTIYETGQSLNQKYQTKGYISDQIKSQDGQYTLVMQNDRNLVIYGPGGPVWARSWPLNEIKSQDGQYTLVMQNDRNLVIYGSSGPVWASNTTISDIKLKEDITPIDNALEKLLTLQGVSFFWKDKVIGEEKEIGLVAQEVENVLPELVHSVDGKFKLVKYENFIPVIIEALKEQQNLIVQLQNEVKSLNQRLL